MDLPEVIRSAYWLMMSFRVLGRDDTVDKL